jgi:hypothetical protein
MIIGVIRRMANTMAINPSYQTFMAKKSVFEVITLLWSLLHLKDP